MVVPLVPWPASAIDHLIWSLGANARANTREHTFLRGIHDPTAVHALTHWLAATFPGHAASVTSAWVDHFPQTYPVASTFHCEIGDLLVVFRLLDSHGTIRRRVGWLLQAKMANDPSKIAHWDPSTKNEIALYENAGNWDFKVRNGGTTLGTFDLRKDPDIAPANVPPAAIAHWSYLQICRVTRWPGPRWPTPLQHLWDSRHSHQAGGFCDGVASMMQQRPSRGVELDGGNVEWTRLCEALLAFTKARDSRLAGGLWQRTCMALVPTTWAHAPQLRAHFARKAGIELDLPLGSIGWRPDPLTFAFSAGSDVPPSGIGSTRQLLETADAGFGVVVLDAISPTRDGEERHDNR